MQRLRTGFYAVTSCQGCLLSVIFNEDEILDIFSAFDIVAFPFIKGRNSDDRLDLCLIEGTVVSRDDLERVRALRERSKIVTALGACACHGNIPALRNFVDENELAYLKYEKTDQVKDIEHPSPLARFIHVDYSIPGCPPDRDEIKGFMKDILLGKEFRNYPDPVCRECRLRENGCLLDYGRICLGPLTRGGCSAICTSHGFDCYGCRGLTDDMNLEAYFRLMEEKGISLAQVRKRMETFIGLEVDDRLKVIKWEALR